MPDSHEEGINLTLLLMDRRTDEAGYRVACTQLKIVSDETRILYGDDFSSLQIIMAVI